MLVLGVIISLVLIYSIGLESFIRKIISADYFLIFLSIVVYFFILSLGLIRWYYLSHVYSDSEKIKAISKAYFLNCFVSSLTPARAGDLMAPSFLSNETKLTLSNSSAIVFTERFSDFLVLSSFALGSLYWLNKNYISVSHLLSGNSEYTYVPLFVILVLMSMVATLVYYLKTHHIVRRIINFVISIKNDLASVIKPLKVVLILLFSLTNWLLHFLKEYFLFSAFINISFIQATASLSISNVITVLSFMPGGVGINAVSNAYIVKLMDLDWQGAATSVIVGTVIFMSIRMLLGLLFNRHLLLNDRGRRV